MADDKTQKPKKVAERDARLKAALRANLSRRKAASRPKDEKADPKGK